MRRVCLSKQIKKIFLDADRYFKDIKDIKDKNEI